MGEGSGLRVQGSGFRVQGSGFRVQGRGSRGGAIALAESLPACVHLEALLTDRSEKHYFTFQKRLTSYSKDGHVHPKSANSV
jgi:hypothetical protein